MSTTVRNDSRLSPYSRLCAPIVGWGVRGVPGCPPNQAELRRKGYIVVVPTALRPTGSSETGTLTAHGAFPNTLRRLRTLYGPTIDLFPW